MCSVQYKKCLVEFKRLPKNLNLTRMILTLNCDIVLFDWQLYVSLDLQNYLHKKVIELALLQVQLAHFSQHESSCNLSCHLFDSLYTRLISSDK